MTCEGQSPYRDAVTATVIALLVGAGWGDSMHVILEDGNVGDEHLLRAAEDAETFAAISCLGKLLPLNEEERADAIDEAQALDFCRRPL